MTGNISYLSDFEEINGGYAAFGGNPKGGKIIGKGKIRTGKLDFDDVYFVKKLKFNLFSVSQMCDKKNSVLFTNTECIVLSSDFKLPDVNHLPDASQVLLRVHRENNMYNVNLKNIVPFGDLPYLFANETIDESNLWHRRLGHIDFKTINKLVKELEDITYFDDEDDVGAEADFNNLETSITVSPIPSTRVHKDHHVYKLLVIYLQLLKQEEELLQFKMQKVWILVDLPHGKRAIGTKWVFMNKKDKRGIVVRNKARLVVQGHTREEGIDYKEVFAPVARIEAIRLFLAYSSFMGFMVYQMDVKSAFLYQTIEKEVYGCQPLGFEEPDHLDKVYKVVMALYGLHQAPRAWYETLANYLLENGFQRGKIDQIVFIKRQKGDILLVQIYVDDIIFGATNKDLCKYFEKLMKDKFQMSLMGELTFFLGLQVKQKKDGIFISQDKYVAEILRKFRLTEGKSASTPIDTEKPLLKYPDGKDVDVHTYRSMIGSMMYLTSLRQDIMFASDCESFPPTSLYDRFQPSDGYHDVPPPYTGTFMPPKPDLVFNTASTAVETDHPAFTVSDSEDESETKAPQIVSSFVQSSEQVKSPRHSVKHVETTIPATTPKPASPKPASSGKRRNSKACFVCKSMDHLIKDYDYHAKKMVQPTPRNHAHRGNDKQYAPLTHTNPQKHMVPAAVLTQSKPVSITVVRPVSAVVPKFRVTQPRHAKTFVTKSKSPIIRYLTHSPSPLTSNSPPRVTAVKAPVGNPQQALKDKGVIDSGCSRHMTGNMSYLSDFEELNGGYVAFVGNPKGGKIFGKGKIKTGSGPTWLFDIDSHTRTMNYQPVTARNQTNLSAGFQDKFDAEKAEEEIDQQYVLFPVWSSGYRDLSAEFEDYSDNSINEVNAVGAIVPTVGPTYGKSSFIDASQLSNDPDMPELEDITYFDDEDDVGPTNNQLSTSSNPRQQATINNRMITIQPIQGRQNFMSTGSSRPFASGSGGASAKQRVIVCYNCKGEGHMSKKCTKPKRKRDAEWFKDKVLLVQAQANGQVLQEEELEFLVDPGMAESSRN
nr:putative ribonuclease H-like domain-containing protein [Tanacetum cinerariifolium]